MLRSLLESHKKITVNITDRASQISEDSTLPVSSTFIKVFANVPINVKHGDELQ